MATRKVIDCRWFPTENACDVAISGNEEEVLKIAVQHAVQSTDTRTHPSFDSSCAPCCVTKARSRPHSKRLKR